MQYYNLKSVIGSRKKPIPLKAQPGSFSLKNTRVAPYIEPTFTKEAYPTEKPAILLVSAVGASGKTTTAHAIAHDTGLPVLDLAQHKPVGDNTLTGILTTACPVEKISEVLAGLQSGEYGIIIDGLDEGRSKTTEQAFEAFLDDLIERSRGARSTSIVVFGRGQVLLSTWLYLTDGGADVGLVQIDPFNLIQAKDYIDAYVQHQNVGQRVTYEQARDGILERLGAAFSPTKKGHDEFLSFIGYPPVLDAIATLLRTEQNYHRVRQSLNENGGGDMEVRLLIRIASLLLRREREEKALPNFIDTIASKADGKLADQLRDSLYNEDEQAARILARALGQPFPQQVVSDVALNDEYEKSLAIWCPEHPFLDDSRLRNVVFEAVSVARCIVSENDQYRALAFDYVDQHRPTYHLLYFLNELAGDVDVGARAVNVLIQACSDFMGKTHEIGIEVSGLSWDEPDLPSDSQVDVDIRVSARNGGPSRQFHFGAAVAHDTAIHLGPFLTNTAVTVPCDVVLMGVPSLDCAGTCQITAKCVRFDTDMVVRSLPDDPDDSQAGLYLDVEQALGHASAVVVRAGAVEINCVRHSLAYPLAKYTKVREMAGEEPQSALKYLRLRRILQEFASHSRGGLAKYRDKIEHERVLRGSVGQSVLAQLLKEGVLHADPKFYHVDSDKLASVLRITWQDLRQRRVPRPTEEFLQRVP